MKVVIGILLCALIVPIEFMDREDRPIQVLVVTGGHGFDREPFFDMFRALPGVSFEEFEHPNAHTRLTPHGARKYDVIVLYDMWQTISDEARAGFIAMLKEGKGIVALHHAICAYNGWPEYQRVIGGKFRIGKVGDRPASVFKHDVRFRLKVHGGHPVTSGLKDFDVFDETYGDFDVHSGVRKLLTTDDPTSGKVVGWAHRYGRSRVAVIQPGHGPQIFAHPSYRKLLLQAIRWSSERDDQLVPRFEP